MNAANDQHVVFGFDFPNRFRNQTRLRCIDLARLQRASEGAGQSASGSGDDIIEGGRMRLEHLGRNFVMLGHRAVHPEDHRMGFGRKPRPPERPSHAFDSHLRTIDDVRHRPLPRSSLYRTGPPRFGPQTQRIITARYTGSR